MVKVLIADDHPLVREGLKRVLSEAGDISVAAEAANGQEVIEKLKATNVDIVLLDLLLPDRSGLDVLTHVRREHPAVPVLVVSIHSEDQYAVRMVKSGAHGYIAKGSDPEDIIRAVRKVAAGGRSISPVLSEQLAADLELDGNGDRPAHQKLSDREYEVLCLLATGHTVSQIAASLGVSVKTISTYRLRVLEKMRLKNNAELTYYVVSNGLTLRQAEYQ